MSDMPGVIEVKGVHEFVDSFPEGASQTLGLQDRAKLMEDPESPRDIVHENVLVLFPLALFFVFLLFGLVIAFSE